MNLFSNAECPNVHSAFFMVKPENILTPQETATRSSLANSDKPQQSYLCVAFEQSYCVLLSPMV